MSIRTVGRTRIVLPALNNLDPLVEPPLSESANIGTGFLPDDWFNNGIWVLRDIPQLSGIEFTPILEDVQTGSYSIWGVSPTFIGSTPNYSFVRICTFSVSASSAVSVAPGIVAPRYCSITSFTNDTGKDSLAFVVGPANQRSVIVDAQDYDTLVIQQTSLPEPSTGLVRQWNS